jgi:predicted RNase H-like HicB family nuclease
MKIEITAQLDVGVRWDAQAQVFVSYAPALELYSQGPTEEEAFRAIESAMRLYLITAHGSNKLDDVLKRHGFVFKRTGFAVAAGIGSQSSASGQYVKILQDGGFARIEPKSIPLELTQV